jgi:hypothetical protein
MHLGGGRTPPESNPTKIHPEVPGGCEGSLGTVSAHEVRLQTDDSAVEATAGETPALLLANLH